MNVNTFGAAFQLHRRTRTADRRESPARAGRAWPRLSDVAMRQMSFGQSCKARRELGYDSGMYSELVLEHFRNPRNAGKL
ncbi:MAG: hypothetical protein WA517_23245, partial [Candidatus Acidiferrum sp.]